MTRPILLLFLAMAVAGCVEPEQVAFEPTAVPAEPTHLEFTGMGWALFSWPVPPAGTAAEVHIHVERGVDPAMPPPRFNALISAVEQPENGEFRVLSGGYSINGFGSSVPVQIQLNGRSVDLSIPSDSVVPARLHTGGSGESESRWVLDDNGRFRDRLGVGPDEPLLYHKLILVDRQVGSTAKDQVEIRATNVEVEVLWGTGEDLFAIERQEAQSVLAVSAAGPYAATGSRLEYDVLRDGSMAVFLFTPGHGILQDTTGISTEAGYVRPDGSEARLGAGEFAIFDWTSRPGDWGFYTGASVEDSRWTQPMLMGARIPFGPTD